MDISDFRDLVQSIAVGKHLPSAVYVYRDSDLLGDVLNSLVLRLAAAYGADQSYNVLKFRTDALRISFLAYPNFFEEPHPELSHAITIDLATGKHRRIDYSANPNPPILHRKETLLPANHPQRDAFEALTRREEECGLYEDVSTIGFKKNWQQLLAEKGLKFECGKLVPENRFPLPRSEKIDDNGEKTILMRGDFASTKNAHIDRHKTALNRYDLSKPVKTLFENDLLPPGTSVFDYGCGHGADVRGLQALGYTAEGWDPAFCSGSKKIAAEVVNLGYVLNVIEDPAERLEALADAYRYTKRILVVAALINQTVELERSRAFRDGVLTRRNTFQKFFEQQELHQYIEDVLETTAVPVSLGIFYVFRNPAEQQDFLSARNSRRIDWSQVTSRLGLGAPPETLSKRLYEANRELLDSFGSVALTLGRFPKAQEFPHVTEVLAQFRTLKRALRVWALGRTPRIPGWSEIARRFGIGIPPKPRWQQLYDEHTSLLEAFFQRILQLGRLPNDDEFPRLCEIVNIVGSPKTALRIFLKRGGREALVKSRQLRRNDLIVYLAMANLRKRIPLGHLSQSLRADIKEFFGNYGNALRQGLDLLYAAGDPDEIELACENLGIGWQDQQALYVHQSLLPHLPSVLRAYIGCAIALFGDVEQADVIKVHRASGKVTFLIYDDFEGSILPKLTQRIKINLRTRWVEVFHHQAENQTLEAKERFLRHDDSDKPGISAL